MWTTSGQYGGDRCGRLSARCGNRRCSPHLVSSREGGLGTSVDIARRTRPCLSWENAKFSTIPIPYYSYFQILIKKEKIQP